MEKGTETAPATTASRTTIAVNVILIVTMLLHLPDQARIALVTRLASQFTSRLEPSRGE